MRVEEVMHHPVVTCCIDDHLGTAARLMWEQDCGALPVVDQDGRVRSMITDRDICMAAYTKGLRLDEIPVRSAMSQELFSCHSADRVSEAEKLMRENQVRRLPVVDAEGRPLGILTLNDLAREAGRVPGRRPVAADVDLLKTLAGVCGPHRGQVHVV
jgi:CBS domain-containing protein